jgi:hypothetical protein
MSRDARDVVFKRYPHGPPGTFMPPPPPQALTRATEARPAHNDGRVDRQSERITGDLCVERHERAYAVLDHLSESRSERSVCGLWRVSKTATTEPSAQHLAPVWTMDLSDEHGTGSRFEVDIDVEGSEY